MVKTNSIKNKILSGALAMVMACGVFSMTPDKAHADSGYQETITVPEGLPDGTYYGLQEVSNVMPGVGSDHHPFSYTIEVAVTVENQAVKDVRVSHVDQTTARALDVDYMNWASSDLSSMNGIGTSGKTVTTGVDSVSGATKSSLGIFRAAKDALENKTTEPAFGSEQLADNAVTAEDAEYPAAGEAVTVKLDFDESIKNPENFAIYNDGIAKSQYGGIRFDQGEVVSSKNGATATLADADYDYDSKTQTLKIYNTAGTGAGSYTINMYDTANRYEDINVSFELNDASVKAGDITIEGNTVKIADKADVTLDQLLKRVESVEVAGTKYVTYKSNHGIYQTSSPGSEAIGEDGVVNLSAKLNPIVNITEKDYNITRAKNGATPIKSKNESGYSVKLNIAGYPDAEGTVINKGNADISFRAAEDDLTQNYEDENGGAFIPEIKVSGDTYKLASSNKAVAKVRAKNNAVSIKGSGSTTLTVTSTNPYYVVTSEKAEMVINAPSGSVSYTDGAVSIDTEKCGTKLADYLGNAVIKITDKDGKTSEYTASDVIDSTGKIDLDASVRQGRQTVTVFPSYGEYSFTISYAGFEDVKGNIVKEKKAQTITTGSSKYTKTYGNAAFSLSAKSEEDAAMTYKSSNTKVAAVSEAGKVTIKGAGTATITINAAETDNYKAASETVTLTVKKASQSISIKNASKTIKASSVKKSSKTYSFTVKGKKTALKTSALTKTQKKAISKVSVSGNTVKVTVKKSAKKGTYKLSVYAASTANYNKSATKTITVKIK